MSDDLRTKILSALGDAPVAATPPTATAIDYDRLASAIAAKSAPAPAAATRQPGDHPGPVVAAAHPWERPSNPFTWSADDVARLEALKGPREAHRIIRQKAEEYARTMRIQTRGGGR